jgi:hypothetical protein
MAAIYNLMKIKISFYICQLPSMAPLVYARQNKAYFKVKELSLFTHTNTHLAF